MTRQRCIRVMIADDHVMFRECLAALLRGKRDLDIVGEIGSGQGVAETVEKLRPDVLLFAPHTTNTVKVLRQISERSPKTKVLVVLSECFDDRSLFENVCYGASGYIPKSANSAQLVKAILAVHAGEAWIERRAMGQLLKDLPRHLNESGSGTPGGPDAPLTERESQVARLVAEGLINREIAERLFLSEKTVKSHLVNVFRKLGIRHRVQLAARAYRRESSLGQRR